jgi:hypothetical protein
VAVLGEPQTTHTTKPFTKCHRSSPFESRYTAPYQL